MVQEQFKESLEAALRLETDPHCRRALLDAAGTVDKRRRQQDDSTRKFEIETSDGRKRRGTSSSALPGENSWSSPVECDKHGATTTIHAPIHVPE